MYIYKAEVVETIDGDTVLLEVDLGFRFKVILKFRLAEINAPELRAFDPKPGIDAKNALATMFVGKDLVIRTKKDSQEKYGRFLVYLYDGVPANSEPFSGSLNERMVTEGFAKKVSYA